MILGHGHPAVLEAVQKAAVDGFSFGAPTEREVELAEAILAQVPSMDMVRLVSSGTEAGMSALRLARGATGRSKIIKFEGCYHGHADALLVKAGSGLATFGNPTSAGVPPEVVQHTLVLEYNNIPQLEEAFALHGKELACLMIEPIAGNMNFVRASVPFMQRCRELCTQYGALLVFDEVMTGFRVALGSAQSVYAKSYSRLQTRYDRAGQSDWRWHATRRFWRPARNHAATRTHRPCLPSGHFERQPRWLPLADWLP
jgi:glutamate-1-semialdehyde 2,1-aminomutase